MQLQPVINFALPVYPLVLFQLSLAIGKTMALHTYVCAAAMAPSFLEAAVSNCRSAQVVAYGIASNLPSVSTSLQAFIGSQLCSDGLAALWVLEVYIELVFVVVLPLGCTYIVEYKAKQAFAKSKGLRIHHMWKTLSWAGLGYLKVAMAVTLFSLAWILVEHAYLLFRPNIVCGSADCKQW